MKIKAEIITIISMNHGNRLQNYALQESLKKIGVIAYTDDNNMTTINKLKGFIHGLRNKTSIDRFHSFNHHIKWNNITKMNSNCIESFDFYLAGSDQIWNPMFEFNSAREFLDFAPVNKRYAYAASIGIRDYPKDKQKFFKTHVKKFKKISVREKMANILLENLAGVKSCVVLDPTLLLSKNEWDCIASETQIKIKEPYLIKYILGIRNSDFEEYIDEYAKKNNLKIIDITKSNLGIGPAEFVYLFKNCTVSFIDSFHGTVFSIIYKKQFVTLTRPNEDGFGEMNSRFETLFEKLNLRDRQINYANDISCIDIPIDYNSVNKLLEKEIDKSYLYLKSIISEVK